MESSSYKNMVKSTSVFGGAQIVQMLISILRSKFVAIFLGSAGMGINAIFQSTIAVVFNLLSFGVFQSAVRDFSQAFESKDLKRLTIINQVFSKIVFFVGILMVLIFLAGAVWFSKIAFQDTDHSWYFALLSIYVFFTALSTGKVTFLQGTRNLTYLAKASILGAVLSLLTSIPLLYFFGVLGIVLSLISSSILIYLVQLYFSNKIKLEEIDKLEFKETVNLSLPILKLGSVLMISSVTITVFTYVTNIYIGRYGRIEDLGFFQGVSSIIAQSIAVVTAVLASDFFPRLAAVHAEKEKVNILVNQQSELISLIIAPIMIVLIVFAPLIVRVLLSTEFLVIVPMLRWMSLSLLVRGIWLTMSYIILSKGDKKAYFIYDALLGNGLVFIFNIYAYSKWGLQGLGISFLTGSVVVAILLYVVVYIKYGFKFEKQFIKTLGILLMLTLLPFISTLLFQGWIQYTISFFFLVIMICYCFKVLNERIGVIEMFKVKFRR
ncbi:oligosaccharide flippase family protein [Pedobacter psychrodurus]|uniref:oligosaccharide flippase family protein n=1 Tax=Pedobacter psychrodurus TaxID=2530456 RepID=UPI00292D0DD2|nr:oligosaccharide flippase family protein [Pedobacter psychrodurus]